jgi:hypothetical protein
LFTARSLGKFSGVKDSLIRICLPQRRQGRKGRIKKEVNLFPQDYHLSSELGVFAPLREIIRLSVPALPRWAFVAAAVRQQANLFFPA